MREKILEALKKIQAGERPLPEMGICANVYEILGSRREDLALEENIYSVIEEMSPRWPNYAGDPAYPVEGSSEVFWSAVAKRNRWDPEDDHGALRLDLLAWLIEELSK